MAKKAKVSFVCQECGYDTPSWYGKCPECGAWNSFKEVKFANPSASTVGFVQPASSMLPPQKLGNIAYQEKSRISTEFAELNTVLGGGIVLGSATLLAGDPGVGKSTLLLQLCLSLANAGKKILYIAGEESSEQVKMRAERISQVSEKKSAKKNLSSENLYLIATSDPDAAISHIENEKPDLVVVDSIQTMQSGNVAGLSGSVSQVRYAALQYIRAAKSLQIPVVLVGHVTKEGMVAGPMVLSHMVDTVLFLEGEKSASTRILRSLKNRFGPVDEVGIFIMGEVGMMEVKNPEQIFLREGDLNVPGSVLVATLEGSRSFLVELQALAVYSKLAMPRRVVSGVDQRRVELLLAVLQKHVRLPLENHDIFVNVAGGLKISDPGIDLGICLAVYSSLKNMPLTNTVGIAEVGLLGELRGVNGLEKRVREAQKLGYKEIITASSHRFLRDVMNRFEKPQE
jgi:DNA repair protein RadA/Sms